MVRIIFETAEGQHIEIDAPATGSVMEAAKANDIPGIDADCGGSMVCGTCHVILEPTWQARLPEQTAMERELLEYVPEPLPNTRLTCQLAVADTPDGIVLKIPRLQR